MAEPAVEPTIQATAQAFAQTQPETPAALAISRIVAIENPPNSLIVLYGTCFFYFVHIFMSII